MPELPEVETIAAGLRKKLIGLEIQHIELRLPSLLRNDRPGHLLKLKGRRITAVWRRGKLLIIEGEGGICLLFHLKMTGQLLWVASEEPSDRHTHLVFSFEASCHELRFRDVRKFGFLRCLSAEALLGCHELRDLGPEPLELDFPAFCDRLKKRKGRLKSLLLNQTFLAGIGNIYADEMLFEAGLHPLTPAARLTKKNAEKLWTAMRNVLERAVEAGGSSIRDYKNADGELGSFQNYHNVYGRETLPCPRCGGKIRRLRIGGRSSFFCPSCQKPKRI
jgi:formamidopyrimidine-DNA glycosylase